MEQELIDNTRIMPGAVRLLEKKLFGEESKLAMSAGQCHYNSKLNDKSCVFRPADGAWFVQGERNWHKDEYTHWTQIPASKVTKKNIFHNNLVSDTIWERCLSSLSDGLSIHGWLTSVVQQGPCFTFDEVYDFFLAVAIDFQSPAFTRGEQCYVFDHDLRLRCMSVRDAGREGWVLQTKTEPAPLMIKFGSPVAWLKASEEFQPGMTLRQCMHLFLTGRPLDEPVPPDPVQTPYLKNTIPSMACFSQPRLAKKGYTHIRRPIARILWRKFQQDGLTTDSILQRPVTSCWISQRFLNLDGKTLDDMVIQDHSINRIDEAERLYHCSFLSDLQWLTARTWLRPDMPVLQWLAAVAAETEAFTQEELYQQFLKEGRAKLPARVEGDSVLYFDDRLICRRTTSEQAKELGLKLPEDPLFIDIARGFCSYLVWDKISAYFRDGMPLFECLEPLRQPGLLDKFGYGDDVTDVDTFVQTIMRPQYSRAPEYQGQNVDVVDFVRVKMGLISPYNLGWKPLMRSVRGNRKALAQKAMQAIIHDPNFKKYGVPINFFRLSEYTVTRDRTLVFTFELKKLGR